MLIFFNFNGRINRLKYFLQLFILGFSSTSLGILARNTNNTILNVIIVFLHILLILKTICISIQRLHDLKRPAIHIFLGLIPFYNIYFHLILLFKKGNETSNEYGDNPLN